MFEFLLDPRYYPDILQGLSLTIEITLFGVALGLLLGTLLAIGDIYGGKLVRGAIAVYVEFFRGSPLFVQLFIAVYTVPAILNMRIDHYVLAFLVFGLNSAGYQKGYIKGAMQTIFDDQMAAGLSVGMSKLQTLRYVIMPQAYRIVIPSWTNEFCSLNKKHICIILRWSYGLSWCGSDNYFWNYGSFACVVYNWLNLSGLDYRIL